MRMRALFWKIFLSFWLVQAAFIGATALLLRRALPEARSQRCPTRQTWWCFVRVPPLTFMRGTEV